MIRTWSLAGVLCGVLAASVSAVSIRAAESEWLHARVIPAEPNVQLRPEANASESSTYTAILTADSVCLVADVEGDWLWVGTKNVQGWVHKDSVLRYDDAVEQLTEKLKVNPGDRLALEVRGATRFNRGEYERAADDFTAAIDLDLTDAAAYNNRGNCYDLLGEHDRALADYDEAIRLEPDVAMHFHNRGIAWQNKRQPAKASEDFTTALSLLAGGEASVQAVEAGRELPVARAMKAQVKYRMQLAGAKAATGDFRPALADLKTAVQLDPLDAEAHNALAWLLATCPSTTIRDAQAARTAAEKACELSEQKIANHLDTLAAAWAAAGDFKTAIEWQTKAVSQAADADPAKAEYAARLKQYQEGRSYVAPLVVIQ